MILKPELVKRIKDYFNLNIYETKVWLALLSKGIASAGEIAELSGVPRSRTYDVLESLEKQGFAIEKIGKPTKYIVIKPTMVLEKLKRKELQKAQNKVKVLDNLKETKEYAELEELHNSTVKSIKKEDVSGAIRGKSNIINQVRDLLGNAEKQVLVCLPASELLEKARVYTRLFEKLSNQKISVKLALNGKEQELKQVERKYNIKPKKTNLNSKFFIIDRKQVLFSLNNTNDEQEMAVWLNTEFFTQSFATMFENSFVK